MSDTGRLADIERRLDELHESCPADESGCWCCCMVCTETDVPEEIALQDEFWRLVSEAAPSSPRFPKGEGP